MAREELVTPPVVEPVLLEEAKDHLRESGDPTPQDTEIEARIQAAREVIEQETGRALITQTWRYYLDRFPSPCRKLHGGVDPGWISLKPPVIDVTSVKYIDSAGVEQTLVENTDYVVMVSGTERHIRPVYGGEWPTPRDEPDAVRIVFDAGYGASPADVPDALKAAVRLMVGDLYEHREGSIIGTIVADNPTLNRLIGPYRIRQLVA